MIRYYITTAYNETNQCKPGDAVVRYQLTSNLHITGESDVFRVRHLFDYGAPLFKMNKSDLIEFVPATELEFSPA
jgi:hypothetical protein